MENPNDNLNADNGDVSSIPSDTSSQNFFLDNGVEDCCYPHLKIIFKTLLLQKKIKQQELADHLQLDKAYISRMVNGRSIPPLRVRLKVAEFFGVDSVLIWRDIKK